MDESPSGAPPLSQTSSGLEGRNGVGIYTSRDIWCRECRNSCRGRFVRLSLRMGTGGEFELSQEVLSVLPADPYEQLDMARRITALAVSSRMSKLEAETGKLRQKVVEKDHVIHGLQGSVASAQSTTVKTNAMISKSMDEQAKLVVEKNTLAAQVKKLMRDVAKLETFKRTLMQSLQEEDDKAGGEGGTLAVWKASQAETTVTKAQIFEDDGLYANSSLNYKDDSVGDRRVTPPKIGSGRTTPKQIIRSARGTPRMTPTGSPKHQSRKGSPQFMQFPASLPTSRSSSPPSHGSAQSRGSTRLDGKEFFRQARSRLTYEQFSSFLTNIKELNAHRQTREETLSKAEEIFGPDNRDLYNAFEGILSRHLPS